MNCKPGSHQSNAEWHLLFRTDTDKWLAGLIKELETTYKDKLDLMMKVHPLAEDGKSDMNGHLHFCDPNIHPDLRLHPPVEALMNAIITDPGKQAFLTFTFRKCYFCLILHFYLEKCSNVAVWNSTLSLISPELIKLG